MILDKNLEFADAVSVAAGAGTANIGNLIDIAVLRDIGDGQPLYLVISVDTEIITGGTAGTIAFQLVSDSTETVATDGNQTIHAISDTFVTDDTLLIDDQLRAGGLPFVIALPMEGKLYERYLAVQAVIATTTVTVGAINAFLTLDPPHTGRTYPDASN